MTVSYTHLIGVPELGGGYTDSRLDLTVFSQRDRHAADRGGGFLVFIGDPGAADILELSLIHI